MKKQELNTTFRQKQFQVKQKWDKSNIRISRHIRDIIHGYVMSDGYIRSGILTVDQAIKQKRFVTWLYDNLEPIRTSGPIKKVERIHPKTQKKSYSLRFYTKAILDGFHYMWYEPTTNKKGIQTYKKKLPKNIHCFFNEIFISVWYAGDGTKILGSVGAKFEVTSFSVKERLKLKALFLSKFNIHTQIISSGVSKKGNSQWALKIPAKEYPKFRAIITKFDLIPTVFPYKLHKKV